MFIVVWTENAWLVRRCFDLDSQFLDLMLAVVRRISLPLVASLGLTFITPRGRWQIGWLVVLVIFVVVIFGLFIILRSWLATELAFYFSDIHPNAVRLAITLPRNSAIVEPRVGGEVYGFCAIIAEIIARVIAVRKCDYKFALVMNKAVDADIVLRLE